MHERKPSYKPTESEIHERKRIVRPIKYMGNTQQRNPPSVQSAGEETKGPTKCMPPSRTVERGRFGMSNSERCLSLCFPRSPAELLRPSAGLTGAGLAAFAGCDGAAVSAAGLLCRQARKVRGWRYTIQEQS